MMHTLFLLQNIFREVFDDDSLIVAPETGAADVNGWDSVAQVKLVLAIEEQFGFQFSEDEVSSIRNVGGFVEAVERRKNQAKCRMFLYRGETEAALAEFGKTLQAAASPDADVLLHRVRLLLKAERFSEAIAEFRLALQQFPPYFFFIRGEKVLDRLIASDAWQPRRKAKIALLSSSTTALLSPVLRAAGFREGVQFDVYEGVYGNYRQEILDPRSELYRFEPDLVILILNHRDLGLPPSGGRSQADAAVAELRGLWQTLRDRRPCHIVQVGFDAPPGGSWASLENVLPEGRRRLTREINSALAENLPPGVSLVDADEVAAEVGPEYWSDAEWHNAKQYPSSTALPRLADHLCSHCTAALGLGAKVLALDLDNTLWGGVIGEDLLGGIRIGPPSAEGEAYLALQRYVKELQQRGVLLAVCSKNNLQDAELPFREHEGMCLKLADFAAFAANWEDKAANLQTIAADLSLGLDSFVFLDDNPMERALVRSRLPEVAVPECGSTPVEMLAALRRGLYFQSVALTREDQQRHGSYRSNAVRKTLERTAGSLDEFLASLEMTAEHGPVDAATLPRVAQLINKTNQFNLTTRRYTEEQVRTMAASAEWWCRWFRLADRFGDYGLIGVILARKAIRTDESISGGLSQFSSDENGTVPLHRATILAGSRDLRGNPPVWTIDTWLMSCRVLGRKMENFMAHALLSAARSEGAVAVDGQYVPTAKNALVKELYPQLGFTALLERNETQTENRIETFGFDLQHAVLSACPFIQEKIN